MYRGRPISSSAAGVSGAIAVTTPDQQRHRRKQDERIHDVEDRGEDGDTSHGVWKGLSAVAYNHDAGIDAHDAHHQVNDQREGGNHERDTDHD